MLKQRVITAFILIAVIAGAVAAGKWAVVLIIGVCAVGGAFEYSRLVTLKPKFADNLPLMAANALTVIASVYLPQYLFQIAVISILLIFMISIMTPEPDAARSVLLVWGYIYSGLFLALGIRLLLSQAGYYVLIPAIASCAACDTAAYFVGRKFGKKKLCPKISPNKTVEGAVGGFIFAYGVFAASYIFCKGALGENALLFFLTGGIVTGITGQFGDLAASLIKRKFSVKDYGDIFPGHGGFLDRIDSYLFVLAAVYILAGFIIKL
ncbi:MAG: phosphatidate cytidylyltransferase [Eubacteriaceae bacterium]|nr:phosphatidate cytidylyltransferase [Eubacteriaceae bacterium]